MTIVHTESSRFEMMEKVADASYRLPNATAVAKELGIPRKEVVALQKDYSDALANDAEARDLARDHLHRMVRHFDALIAKFYKLLDEIDTLEFGHQVAAQKNATLRSIADLESKRLDSLQKAGLLDSAELGDELAKWEEEKEILLSVLNDLCPACQSNVGARLTRLRGGVVQAIDVEVIENE